jgi:hypothetical protein
MQDFDARQTQLAKARAALSTAQTAAAQAAEEQRKLLAQLGELSRRSNPDDPAAAEQKARLEALLKRADGEKRARQAATQRAREAVAVAIEGFATFTDPRRNVGLLSDRSPFLLLPVRVETRFVASGPTGHQLWVRIYPDDCSIDTFEPTLSGTELANGRLYWQGMWRAGGIEADERAAWRGLVAAHGSGRASWIVDTYQPANLPAKPAKAAASDEILVILTQTPLSAAEALAISTYWKAVWLADGESAASQAALTALEAAVGASRAADLIRDYQPYNLADTPAPPAKKSDVALSTSFIVFPADPATKQDPWSQAPRVNHLADRFVVIGYNDGVKTLEAIGGVVSLPLYVGPDPSVDPSETIHPVDGDLSFPDQLQWLVDFDRAVAAGMGLKIDLTPSQARTGFDRLLVLGLELASSDGDAKEALEELLKNHHYGRSGLSIIPQGTPTNNTTGTGSGYTRLGHADESFDDRKRPPLFKLEPDPLAKRDGQWVAELLGIDPSLLARVHGSDSTDQIESRAMQCALWPATLGYWMDKMLTPLFSDAAVEHTRWFFTSYVSGRGAVPAIRIGGQPYGILPTTAFSRIRWLDQKPGESDRLPGARQLFLARLLDVLRKIDADWATLSGQVSYVGKSGDAHKLLLDIIGLHPASVEFYSRYAESLTELFNVINLWGLGPDFWQALVALGLEAGAVQLLSRLGYTGSVKPDILQHVFLTDAAQIVNVIDDRPLSETSQIRAYTDDSRNYIQWLIDAAKTSLDTVYQEQGFSSGKTPEALLYLYLRQALTLGYYDASYHLHRKAAFLDAADLQAMKPEPKFVHVAEGPIPSESRFAALYKTEPRITSEASLLVSDYITRNLGGLAETSHLAEQIDCLGKLAGASTARLERAFAEHIDCCTYRYDAWLLGLVNFQLQVMRSVEQGDQPRTRTGVYIGAYAWLEDLRPSHARLTPVRLPPDIAKHFPGATPLQADPANGGYIHAPSLPHAETAAVLRSGYLANATSANPGTMAVNLSSDRVRLSLSMLEGIRNGQSFGALLGYQFERGLHDSHGLAEVDKFIYPMRKAFPLVADAITTTKTDPGVPIEAIEARNVLDGLKLVAQMRTSNISAYPFGATLPPATPSEAAAITAQANRLLDIYDAIADLALAEGVHQAGQGNFDRIAATLDAYTTGNFPPDPEVVQTPPSGIGLTHRVAMHFQPGLPPAAGATPRASVEPALDAWLATVLPQLDSIACQVVWTDPVTGAEQKQSVTLADLAVRPIDLVDLIKPDEVQSMTELDDRILSFVIASRAPRPDATLRIEYMASDPGKVCVFRLMSLLRSLKGLIARSRPLRATDAMLHNEASPEDDSFVFVDSTRISAPKAALDTLSIDIGAFLSALGPLVADPVANRAAIVSGIDGFLDAAVGLLDRAARFNVGLSGWGFVFAWKHAAFVDLLAKVTNLVTRWNQKLTDFDAHIAAYDALPAITSDDTRFQLLRIAEMEIATAPGPLPASPSSMRLAMDAKRTAFALRRDQFQAILDSNIASFANLLATAKAIATSDLDPQPFDLLEFEDRAIIVAEDLITNLTGRQTEITTRRTSVQAHLDAAAAAAAPGEKVQALEDAAKALLGPDFRIFPEFSLSAAQGDEWASAISASLSGELTKYLRTSVNIDFPVDEWLYGVARVRPNMRSWEQVLMLAPALGRPEPALVPVQFPYEAEAPWLALQYPTNYKLLSDRLLYTAHYVTPFNKAARQCGILLDEWTEVIPATDHTTGIAFNFNRPDNEPPQSFLLVTPATSSGAWHWEDLLGALNETLELAKKRAVEPVHLDFTPYSCFLPATVMAVTLYGISITTSLAAANGVFRYLEEGSSDNV